MEVNQGHISTLFSTSDIISICAAIIALSALGISIWQGVLARKHNQVSIRPHIDSHSNMTVGEDIKITLTNHGVGPALFKSINFSHGNSAFTINNYKDYKDYKDYKALFSSLGIPLEKISHKLTSLVDPAALYQGTEIVMLIFEGTGLDSRLHETVRIALSQLTLEIKYECVYGNTYSLRTKL